MRSLNCVASILVVIVSASLAWAQTAPTSQQAPAIDVSVDPRVELISILFRLAGHPEYNKPRVPAYAKDVDEHFAALKDHPVLKTAKRLRAQYGVTYDAPMSLAVHLKDAANLELILPLEPWPEGLDGRWKPEELRLFLEQARDFAAAGKFTPFFDSHQDLYRKAVDDMNHLLKRQAHLEWFDSFFGTRKGGRFHLVLGMLTGPNCYGVRLWSGKHRDLYCILGVWLVDSQGQPFFNKTVIPTVVHEFAHSYANPLVDAFDPQLRNAGQAIFATCQDQMKKMAYGNWNTMMRESLVRVSVIRYLHRYEGAQAAQTAVQEEKSRGFAWMPGLADLVSEYEQHRRKYPTFEAFMPRVVDFFNNYAASQTGTGPASKSPGASN